MEFLVATNQGEYDVEAHVRSIGEDLLIAARTGLGGRNQHDTNLVTLHRVPKFRELVPNGF